MSYSLLAALNAILRLPETDKGRLSCLHICSSYWRQAAMRRKSLHLLALSAVITLETALCGTVAAQEAIKIGLVMPMTGVLGPDSKPVDAARLYMAQHGDVVAGRKIELIVRDDASVPDNSKRIAQEMLISDKGAILGGGLTPNVLAIAPLVTETKTATVVMVSGTSIVT